MGLEQHLADIVHNVVVGGNLDISNRALNLLDNPLLDFLYRFSSNKAQNAKILPSFQTL